MANRKTEFYMSVKAILDKTQVREDAKELQELLNKTNIDFNSDEFEKRVREIVNKMSKETLKTIGDSFNQAFTLLGKNPIKIDDLIQMPNAQMWEEMGKSAGRLYAKGLKSAIDNALRQINNSDPKSFMKEVDAITQAAGRLTKKNGAVNTTALKELKKNYDYKVKSKDEQSLREEMVAVQEQYKGAQTWEEQYLALLKYKKLYDTFTSQMYRIPEQFQRIGQYSYQQIDEALPRIQTSLQNVLNYMSVGADGVHKALIGLTESGVIDVNVVPTVVDTLDVGDLLGGKKTVEIPVEPIVTTPKETTSSKLRTYKAYRAIQPPSGSNQTKGEALEYWGAEYWASHKETSISYANDHPEQSTILVGTIKPTNPLIIDADGLQWNDFAHMPGLKDLFPGLIDLMRTNGYYDDIGQKYINEQARLAGFDLVRIENVQDNWDADRDGEAPIDNTMAVLNERIVSMTGAFAELEGQVDGKGNKIFSDSKTDVPSYYELPQELTPEQHLSELQKQQETYDVWYKQTLERLQKNPENAQVVSMLEKQRENAQKNFQAEISYYQDLVKQIETPDTKSSEKKVETEQKAADATERRAEAETKITQEQQKQEVIKAEEQPQIDNDKPEQVVSTVSNEIKEEADARQSEVETIKAEDKHLDNVVEDKREEIQVRDENIAKIQEEIGAKKELYRYSLDELEEMVFSGALEDTLKNNPNLMTDLLAQKAEIEGKLSPVKETAKRISQNASIKDIPFDQMYQEATNVAKQLSSMYDEGIRDTEEYITLQYKLANLLGDIALNVGQVEGLSTKSSSELKQWVFQNIKKATGYDIGFSSAINALSDPDQFSVYGTKDVPKNITTGLASVEGLAAELLLYEAGSFGYDIDKLTIDQINHVVELLRKIPIVAQAAEVAIDNVITPEALSKSQTSLSQPIEEAPIIQEPTVDLQENIVQTKKYTEAVNENTQALDRNNDVQAEPTPALPAQTIDTTEAIADNNAEVESAQHVIEVYEEVKRAKVKTTELPDYTREDIADNEALIETLGRVAQKQKEVNEAKAEEPESVVDEVIEDVQTEKPQVPVAVTVDPKEVTDVKETIEQIAESQPPEIPIEPEESKKKDDDDADKAQARADKLEKLALQYERLGDLQAKAEQGIATKINPDLFEKEIQLKQKSLDLTEDEITAFKEKQKVQHDKTATAIADEQAKARAEEVEKLYQQAEKLGDLQAKVDDQHYTRTVQDPEQLKRTIEAKKESLKLSEEELAVLKQRQQVQYDSTAKLLQDQQKKKDDNKDWMKRVKTAQASTGVNAANSIIGSGNKTVVGAIGVTGSTEEFVGKAKELSDKIRALEQLRNTIQAKGAETSAEDQVVLSKQIGLVKELKDEVAGYLAIHDKYSGDNATEIGDDISGFGNLSLDDYKAKLSEMVKASAKGQVTIKGFDNNTKELSYSVKVGANEFVNYSAAVDKVTGKVVILQGQTVKTESFFESIGRKMKELSAYFTGSSLIYGAVNQVKKGIQYVKEIDSALTELKKVTTATEKEYDKFLNTAAKTGAKIGSTISDFTRATAEFSRLGYDISTASEMAEAAIVYQNVGDGIESADAAAESIISTMKGFGLETSESMAIVDRFNRVGNEFSITSKGIGDALQRSASALSEGGNSLDESIGLITAANSVVQDPDSVGTALKTLTLRLRGAKVELEEAGLDAENMVETTATLQKKLLALTGGKVDIMLDANTFKNSTQILREMAEAWKDMTDIERASALELMGGKRQANILSAIIQNFDIVEDAIKASSNSVGSALKENEVYLDSIQGKLDQFTNSLQAMWNSELDSDWIKGFVDFGTILMQIVDKIGLVRTALIGLAVGSMIKGKTGPIGFMVQLFELMAMGSTKIREFGSYVTSLLQSSQPLTKAISDLISAQVAAQASSVAAQFNEQKLTQAQLARKLSTLGLTESVSTLNVAQMSQALQTANISREQRLAIIQSLGLDTSTKALTATQVTNALAAAGVSEANIQTTLSALGLSTANKGLAASFATLWTAIWPVLAIMAGMAAIYGIVKIFDAVTTTTEELADKLSDLKSELSDIQSELDSVNTELETTQSRMAELLAMPSLSFVEAEELAQLKKSNDELQRRQTLLKNQEERMAKTTAKKAQEVVDATLEESSYDGTIWHGIAAGVVGGLTGALGGALSGFFAGGPIGAIFGGVGGLIAGAAGGVYAELSENRISVQDELDREIEEYGDLIEKRRELENKLLTADDTKEKTWWGGEKDSQYDVIKKELDEVNKEITETENYIDTTLQKIGSHLSGITYGQGADKALDYYNTTFDKWEIMYGSSDAKSNAIENLMSQDRFVNLSNSIDVWVQKLKDGDESAKEHITSLLRESREFVAELRARGMDLQDAVDYFTLESGIFDSNTVEGITKQYAYGTHMLKQLQQGISFDIDGVQVNWDTTGIDSLFDEEKLEDGTRKFEARADKFAEILRGMDDDARNTFMHLAESVKNGSLSWSEAMGSFQASGLVATCRLIETEISSLNTSLFKDLGDELSGVIDTFSEFSATLESVAGSIELVNQAQAEMVYSGRVSVETALQLMQSTDNWNELLEIENGNIQLVNNAEEILVQTKLDLIKRNLQAALSTVEAQLAEITATETSADLAYTIEESTNLAVQQLAGNMAYLTAMMKAYAEAAANGEDVDLNAAMEAADKAKSQALAATDYKKNAAAEIGTAELKKKKAELEAMLEMYEGIDTISEFDSGNYYSDQASGGTSNADEAADKKASDALEALRDKYERQITNLNNQQTSLQNEVERLEAENVGVSKEYYKEQITLEEKKLALYQQEHEELRKLERTDEVAEALWEVEHAIQESTLRMVEFRQSIVDLYKTAFDEIGEAYDNQDDLFSDRQNYIEKYRELLELQDSPEAASGYQEQIALEADKMAANTNKLADLQELLARGVASGYLKEGSDEWIEMQDEIRATEEAILDNKIALEQYKEEMKDLQIEAWNTVRDAFDNKNQYYQNQQDYIEGYADYLEALGVDVPDELYDKLISIEEEKRANLVADLTDARATFDQLVADGVMEDSEDYQEAYQKVVDLEKGILDCDIAMAQWAKTMRDMDFEKFERFISRLDDLKSEIEHIQNLLDDEDVAFEDGTWTKEGITMLGLYYQQMQLAQQESKEYAKKIEELNNTYAEGTMSEQEYYERLQELKDGQWESIESYESAKDAIVDMEEARIDQIENGVEKEISAYEELISLKKEELDAERD